MRGMPDVKLSRTNYKTHSGLGGISTSETGTENAPRGANDVPAAARKRSKLRPAAAQYLGHSNTNNRKSLKCTLYIVENVKIAIEIWGN